MKINCLSCGHKVELDDAYEEFEGQVKCWICGVLLKIKTEEGKLKALELMGGSPARKPVEHAY